MDRANSTVAETSPIASAPASFPAIVFSLVKALRPAQWLKNGLLFAGLLFTIQEAHPLPAFGRAALGFALFCLLSGCTYLINDIRDVEADRFHPRKKKRPIASGMLPIPVAVGFAAIGIPGVLIAAYSLLGLGFFIVVLAYLALTLSYSFLLKNMVLIDVMTVAMGFVLRAVAGSLVVPVPPSEWLLLCTFLLALFIALMKRRAEIVALGGNTPTRPILAEYSLMYLDPMITLVATMCLVSYLLYTVLSPTSRQHPYLLGTSLFVLYGLFRYLYLTHQKGLGEAPETVLLKDRPLQINLVLWILAVIAAMTLPAATFPVANSMPTPAALYGR